MEDTRFDDLAKVLGSRKTRRLTLSAVLGGALSVLGLAEADAAKRRGCNPKPNECQTCKKGKCRKTNNGKKCKRGKLLAKANGTACSVGTCQSGTCVAAGGGGGGGGGCGEGLTNCGGVCTNLQTDVANCGACGTTCPTTTTCSGFRCCRANTSLCQVDAQCCSNNCAGGPIISFCV